MTEQILIVCDGPTHGAEVVVASYDNIAGRWASSARRVDGRRPTNLQIRSDDDGARYAKLHLNCRKCGADVSIRQETLTGALDLVGQAGDAPTIRLSLKALQAGHR